MTDLTKARLEALSAHCDHIAAATPGVLHELDRGYLRESATTLRQLAAAMPGEADRERVARAAFKAGWWVNAAKPGEDGAGDQAYFDRCEEVDWREYTPALFPPLASAPAQSDDNPELDATDAAHPAWWRGNDAGVASTVSALNSALDRGRAGFGYKPLQALYDRIAAALASEREAGRAEGIAQAYMLADNAAEQTECRMGGVDPSTGTFECSLSANGKDCLCVERMEAASEIARAIRALGPTDLVTREEMEAAVAAEREAVWNDLPWRAKDIKRGLILFRTSNNAHGHVNYEALSSKVDGLPQVAKDELAAIMRNIASDLDGGSVS